MKQPRDVYGSSGTEDIYKIYAESFRDQAHLDAIVEQARRIVDDALTNP